VYAKQMMDAYVREQLDKMLNWYIGFHTDFKVEPGKYGKYYQAHLEPELWQQLLRTYSNADEENTWQALFTMGSLFRLTARAVAVYFGFTYPKPDDERVSAFLHHIHALDRGATAIY
jgi:aminoglycoside 6-adenylyltransferase